jgi:hypothetical protein
MKLRSQKVSYDEESEEYMKKGWKIVLIVLAALIVAGGIFTGAFFIGRATGVARVIKTNGILPRIGMRMGGWMKEDGMMPGRRQSGRGSQDEVQKGGMMGSYLSEGEISVDEATQAAESYLSTLANDDLVASEVMIFDNGAYVAVKETSTGKGAMELLVDPNTKQVIPEFGPNHMWNLKYGSVGMTGRPCNQGPEDVDAEMTITPEQAAEKAQAYLDEEISGAKVSDDPITFYGYYTFDYETDGKVAGMLSVNGFTGQVWLHTWHGDFVEEAEIK